MSKTDPRPESRKDKRIVATRLKRTQVREVEEAMRRWAASPPPPVNDGEPGYKP